MPTWLITGASGFLGGNLGWWLDGRAIRVGLSRRTPTSGQFDRVIAVDVSDPRVVRSAIADIRPDVIVHAAAFASHEQCETHPEMARHVNVEGARAVAEAASAVGARLIHISTDAVFDGAQGGYRESDEPNPFSVYGETKLLGEHAVLEACPSAVIARTNFFGWSPTGTRSILEFFVNALRSGTRVPGFTDFIVSSLYAQHLAGILFDLASSAVSDIVHVAASDSLSKYEFGVAVATQFGLEPGLIEPVSQGLGPDGISRARNLSLNTDLLAAILGRRAPTQQDGISAAYADQRLSAVLAQKP